VPARSSRDSLSKSGPFGRRVPDSAELDEAVTRAAKAAGETRAEWVRRTLSRAVRRAR